MLDQLPLKFHPVPARPGWYKTTAGDCAHLEARVLRLHDQHSLGRWQLVCGLLGDDGGHAIYAIDGILPVDLAREFGVGSHNAWPTPHTDQARDELARVFEIAPFRPYFADAAGYKCRFECPISRAQADAVEQLLTVGLDGYFSEWSGKGPVLAEVLVAENGLRLWWD